jgi:hypothetical protein
MSPVNASTSAGDPLHQLLEGPAAMLEALEQTADGIATGLAALREALAQERARASELERQLAVTEARLLVETMHAEGLSAQASHLLGLGAEAPSAMEPSGEHYWDGTPKTRLALVYEAAFDAKGRQLGVADPESFRIR